MSLSHKIDTWLHKYKFYSKIDSQLLDEYITSNLDNLSTFKKKESIFEEGSLPTKVYIIKKGKVKITQLNVDGSIQILFIFSEGEIFGFRPLLSNERNPTNAIAVENCELYTIAKSDFLSMVDSSHTFCKQLLFNLSQEYSIFINRLNYFSQRGIKEKIALSLLLLYDKFNRNIAYGASKDIKIDRTELAQYVGTSLENLVRNLKILKDNQIINIKGKSITICDMEALFAIAAI